MLHEYETVVLVKPDIGDDPLNKLAQRIKSIVDGEGGKFLQLSNWGKKKLAYEISKQAKAVYLHAHFLGGSKLPAELERNLRISDDVIRYMTLVMSASVDPSTRESKELETLKVIEEVREEEFSPRRDDADGEFGGMGDDFDGSFEEENV